MAHLLNLKVSVVAIVDGVVLRLSKRALCGVPSAQRMLAYLRKLFALSPVLFLCSMSGFWMSHTDYSVSLLRCDHIVGPSLRCPGKLGCVGDVMLFALCICGCEGCV